MNQSFPLDPDSIIEPSARQPHEPKPRYDAAHEPPKKADSSPTVCCPFAKADSPNEKYADIIRSGYAGKESELTLALGYLNHSVRFSVCSQELCRALYCLALSRIESLKVLGDLLFSLGGDPAFFCSVRPNAVAGSWWNASPAVMRYPRHLGEALQTSLKLEGESAAEYKSIIAYTDDSGIASALSGIVCQKERDIEKLSLLYTRFCG